MDSTGVLKSDPTESAAADDERPAFAVLHFPCLLSGVHFISFENSPNLP
jgi:hypothetical protein